MSFRDAAAATQALESVIATAVEDGTTRVPGLSFIVVAKNGTKLFHHSAGTRGVGIAPPQPVTDDSVFWIASCTKAVTAIACMQLVEQGVLSLDDSEQLETLLPELKNLQVLKEDGTTEPKQRGITLRMLLTHTAGFGYSFFNERLRDWGYPVGLDEFSGDFEDIKQPLLFQPGERWEYGVSDVSSTELMIGELIRYDSQVNLDWAGLALERATKTRLNDYMQKNIFQPLGLENINMFPTPSMKERLVHLHQRGADGKLTRRDHLHRRVLAVESKEAKDLIFQSGGAGLFSTTADYGSKHQIPCPKPSTGISILHEPLTRPRNHLGPPQRWHMPRHRRDHSEQRDSRPDVHQSDIAAPRVRPPGHPRGQANAHQPDPGALPQRRRAAGLGS